MTSAQRKWTCENCGRRNKTAMSPEGTMQCEYCTEVVAGAKPAGVSLPRPVDGAGRRDVVARLRERYGEARELVTREQAEDSQTFAHLEWILGKQRNLDQDEAAFDMGVSELVVLWLQDLASELDNLAVAASAAESRQAAARGLRIATRDFADAFLSVHTGPVRLP